MILEHLSRSFPSHFALSLLLAGACAAAESASLAGTWHYALDRQGEGINQRWFARELTDSIELPGSLEQNRIGDPVSPETKWVGGIIDRSYFTAPEYAPYRKPGNVKVPFWLQPETRYIGAAWYQRDMDVPTDWAGRRLVVVLERPHWKTSAWLDDRPLGSSDSLSVPHTYDLGVGVSPGRHRLTIRVDNTFDPDIGENSHSMSDHTQGDWNGVVGRIELRATAPAWIDDLQVYSRFADRSVEIRGRVGHAAGTALPASVALSVDGGAVATSADVGASGGFSATLRAGAGALPWDEFNPALHRVAATLENGERRETQFGWRDFHADGRQLTINGRPCFLRGTLDCAAYPKTGYPPMDVATWKRILGTIKAHGLNHVRFHSWCPPEAAFVAADELGVYIQVEVSSWPNQSTTLGDGKPVDAWLLAETDRILREYGNHPSFVMLSAGNEPGGDHFRPWLERWVAAQKSRDPRRLCTAASGWPELPENEYHVSPEPRIQRWGEGLKSRINALPPETRTDYLDFVRQRSVPVVSHEIGQWCVYPNFAEMPKYTGYLKPRNLEIFQASLTAHGMGDQAHDFLVASGKLQLLCYKEDIESALRTPQMGGFQLLGLSDFPGQGTALVGVLDAFWEPKGYVSAGEFHRFSGSVVPLARLGKRVFTADERLTADVELANFGAAALTGADARWQLRSDDGTVVAAGSFPKHDLALGGNQPVGRIDEPLARVPAPARYKLVVTVTAAPAHSDAVENDWDVWIYPHDNPAGEAVPTGLIWATRFDDAVRKALEAGGAVVLAIPPDHVAPDPTLGHIELGFSSIFWNTAWTHRQAPHTLGILCDPKAPALASFPTDPWSNWQWWYPIAHAAAMDLDSLPRGLKPTVQVIDDWVTNRKLALVFEAKVGHGRVLVTSVDLSTANLDPVRRQLRASLLAYAASTSFQPTTSVTAEQIESLFARQGLSR